jgi:hypothetical protein
MQGTDDMDTMSAEAREMIKLLRGDSNEDQLLTVWKELQAHVDHVLDREMKSGGVAANKVRMCFEH